MEIMDCHDLQHMAPGLLKIRSTRGLAVQIAKGLRVSQAAISKWKRVPAERVLTVERLTGILRGELRPDLYPEE